MSSLRKKLIAGNWKMNKTAAEASALLKDIRIGVGKRNDVEVVVCPPFTALESSAVALEGSMVKLGAQNMHHEANGAFTGEISAPMLRSLFVTHVILGHSERRTLFGDTDKFVNQKVLSAIKNQLKPILCVGETLAERDAGTTLTVVKTQLEGGLEGVNKDTAATLVIAYEPVWAISSNKGAHHCSAADCREMVQVIKSVLADMTNAGIAKQIPILYGGSVNSEDIESYLKDGLVDGGLVGHASLDAKEFIKILKIAEKN